MQETASSQAENPRKRLLGWLPFSTAIASTLVLIIPVLANPNAQLFYRDTSRLYYPVKQFISERLNAGHLPLWDPWTEAGVSLLGQISTGIFHPFNLLYLVAPFELAFKLNHLLALPMAAAGAYWFARKLGASPWASSAAGIIFGGAGYIVSTSASNLPYALGPAGMPAACAALLCLCERPSAKRLLGASVLLALCNYSGEPQSALFAGVIGGACALGVSQSGTEPGVRERLRRAARALFLTGAWGVAALALSMPAVLPGGIRAHDSQRWRGLTTQELELFAAHPARLAALLVPVAFDDTSDISAGRASPYWEYLSIEDHASFADSICLGMPAMLLALFAFFTDRRGRWLALGGFVCALAATGPGLGVMAWLVRLVPGLGLFRYAEKMLAPASLLFALAAARGFDAAFIGTKRAALALAGLSAASAAMLYGACSWLHERAPQAFEFLVANGQRHIPEAAMAMLVFLGQGLVTASVLSLALALVAVFRAASSRPLAPLVLACACCFVAMMSYASDLLFVAPVALLRAVPPVVDEMVRRAGPSQDRWRFASDDSYLPNHPSTLATDRRALVTTQMIRVLSSQFESLSHVEGVGSYFSLLDDNYVAAYRTAVRSFGILFGVRFVYSTSRPSPREAGKAGFAPFDGGWLRENPPQPRAFLIAHVYNPPAAGGPMAVLADPTFDPATAAVVMPAEHRLLGKVNDSLPPGEAAYQRLSPEQIDVNVSAPAPRLLVVSEHFDAGWHATLDGASVPVLRADGIAIGVPIPVGQHLVELRFWPRGLTAGLLIAGGTLAAFAAVIFLARDRSRGRHVSSMD